MPNNEFMKTQELLEKFENTTPEIVFEWKDKELGAEGWVVINSLRGGAAGGGTRMRLGLDKQEVISLAKTMEVKFNISGPAIGGAKSGINFDPTHPQKTEVLRRWYKAVMPLLKSYYGTGGDLNVDEIHDVIPITESYGLWHPQEGVVNGHYQPNEAQKVHKIGHLRQGVSKVIEDAEYSPDLTKKYTIADLITGFGVAESIKHYYQLWDKNLTGKKAIIQGWGNVGAAVGFYLANMGVKIVGIVDSNGACINQAGFSTEQIVSLFINRHKRNETGLMNMTFDEAAEKLWDVKADIFVPCAGSRMVKTNQLKKLIENGLEVISCGANVPFDDPEIFYGDTHEYVDQKVALIPDFIANCGMARVFAFLMDGTGEITDQAIFNDTSTTIYKALKRIKDDYPGDKNITSKALEITISALV
ncbi:MAG: glutamate dehydrogenase/leucine dehydrogenase [Cyclobacteriaceae bacterium]|jgi:glutamate dehydrogenase/leucine dehydrogenase